jgi:hypothetical protein
MSEHSKRILAELQALFFRVEPDEIVIVSFRHDDAGQPAFFLVLLVVGKIILDWTFHQRVQRKPTTRSVTPSL